MDRKYFRNTAILFASMTITKIIGAVFKIPLANILGGTGMGYFSTAYGLYSPIFAITAAGIPTVMMRLTARNLAAGRFDNAVRTRRTAMLLFSLTGLAGTLTVALFADFFADHIACSPESTPAVIAIAPAVFLCSIASVIRGYHEGMSDVAPSAAAAVTEAASRAVFGLAMAYGVVFWTKYRTENGLDVFGVYYASYEQAYSAVLPIAAAGAVLAVSLSELFGLISLVISDRRRPFTRTGGSTDRMRRIAPQLVREIIPVAASALVMNCVAFVDLLTVTRTLRSAAVANSDFFTREFSSVLSACGGLDGLANFMYGSYTGIAMTVFMLIPSFAGMTEKTSLPEIAASWERKDRDSAAGSVCMLFRAAATIGFPACAGAAALAEPVLSTLYRSRCAEAAICVQPFRILCIGGFFMIIASAMFGIFQAIGKAYIPLLLMIASVGIKAALNPVLMSVPQLNISGAALSTAAGYVFMTCAGAVSLRKYLPQLRLVSCVKTPFLGAVMCGAAAYLVYYVVLKGAPTLLNLAISVVSGALIYGLSLIINSDFRKNRQFIKYAKKISQKHLKNP